MAELAYIGHNTAAVNHLLSNIDDDTLTEVYGHLNTPESSFYRNVAGVEMMRRGLPIDDDADEFFIHRRDDGEL
ncbi:hypothetical protein GFD17_04640 [Bifidobacterium sp. SMB2]|uniref:Uncharacterized protein n=1 Tax=Bifidobacterium saimiriisciurei TaxID=2661627 RepID=A0ABX0C6U0_9BIFI|nr:MULTISPECIES: hypothetical protein [Bifidobacterium]NEG96055.1 hypothetical protein [Bifidobacterium sp. SMB2]NEH10867.1 hypothetical protein [Bifidobacterium saimiriisciurei]